MHQRITIWCPDGIVENVEIDQGYFKTLINHVDRRQFDKHLANISLCDPTSFAFIPYDNAYCSLYLHPTNGFQWDHEVVGEDDFGYIGMLRVDPTG